MNKYGDEYKKIADKTAEILDKEENRSEWMKRYEGYIDIFEKNEEIIRSAFGTFELSPNLGAYLSTTKTKSATKNKIEFDLRYEGQKVATLIVGEAVTVKVDKKNDSTYDGHENISPRIFPDIEYEWNASEAKSFREFFANKPKRKDKKAVSEAKLEDQLLENLSQKTSKGKILKYVQPIDMFGSFFQFPTPLTASKAMSDEVDYRGAGGGHIDILARQGFGPHTKLTVIELKDECKDNEKPEKAIKQAIVYAVFLQRLLRSSQGKRWWKFFEFNKKKELGEVKLPDPLIIQAVIAMPTGKHNATDFVGEVEILSSEDKIELHYLYFNHKEGTLINGVTTSLPFQN